MKKIRRVLCLHTLIFCVLFLYARFGQCPLFALTKIPCPLCGITRAFIAALSGDLRTAALFHPLYPLFPAAVVYMAHYRLFRLALGARPAGCLAGGLIGIFLLTYIIRFFI